MRHGMPDSVRDEYLDTAATLYAEGVLSLAELESTVEVILAKEIGPRAFRERMAEEYGICWLRWVPLLEGG